MSEGNPAAFDPRAILSALQAHDVTFVLIGGLARVARGSDEITTGVDICPTLKPENIARLDRALAELSSARRDGQELMIAADTLAVERVLDLDSPSGDLKVVATPIGVPRGYEALKAGASNEHLGHGLRPEIASTGDLLAMSAALRRDADLQQLPMLRRILELEAEPCRLVATPVAPKVAATPRLKPGDADRMSRPPARRTGPGPGTSAER